MGESLRHQRGLPSGDHKRATLFVLFKSLWRHAVHRDRNQIWHTSSGELLGQLVKDERCELAFDGCQGVGHRFRDVVDKTPCPFDVKFLCEKSWLDDLKGAGLFDCEMSKASNFDAFDELLRKEAMISQRLSESKDTDVIEDAARYSRRETWGAIPRRNFCFSEASCTLGTRKAFMAFDISETRAKEIIVITGQRHSNSADRFVAEGSE